MELCKPYMLPASLRKYMQEQRLPQAIILCGPAGVGKKMLARSLSAYLLCEKEEAYPCGVCKGCRTCLEDQHPDLLLAKHSGKLGGFQKAEILRLLEEANTSPHSAPRKVIVFEDADKMTPESQNALLKSIEEPLDSVFFIFTARTKSAFLSTILSRATVFEIRERSTAEIQEILIEKGYSFEDAQRAISVFHGNIGKCLAYLSDEELQNKIRMIEEICFAIADHQEYQLLLSCTRGAKNRDIAKEILDGLELVLRDALVLSAFRGMEHTSVSLLGCSKSASHKLSAKTEQEIRDLISLCGLCKKRLVQNVNPVLVMSDFCVRYQNITE